MKTTTEYRAMMFGASTARRQRRHPRRLGLLRAIERRLVVIYSAAGLGLMADTGLLPFDWRFWFIFGPFFAAVELSLWELKSWGS